MSTEKSTTSPNEHFSQGLQYLDAAVRTASPARLRLMLIERAIDVASGLVSRWDQGQDLGANEQSIHLLDLLTELLNGVRSGNSPPEQQLCQQVADLYVFLSKHLVEAEANNDVDSIKEIRVVLQTEAETWRSVCAREIAGSPAGDSNTAAPGGLDLQG